MALCLPQEKTKSVQTAHTHHPVRSQTPFVTRLYPKSPNLSETFPIISVSQAGFCLISEFSCFVVALKIMIYISFMTSYKGGTNYLLAIIPTCTLICVRVYVYVCARLCMYVCACERETEHAYATVCVTFLTLPTHDMTRYPSCYPNALF